MSRIRKVGIVISVAVIILLIVFIGTKSVNQSSETNYDKEGITGENIIENNSGDTTQNSSGFTETTNKNTGVESETTQSGNENTDKNEITGSTENDESAGNTATSVDIVMVGDVLLHTPVSDSGLMEDGSYNFSHLFTNVKNEISAADLAIVNQEVILGGRELGISGYPAFNGPYEVGDAIADAGFDVVLHATNHALDKGRKGILNCMNYWSSNHPEIGVLGINTSSGQQNNIYIKEVNGIKIAILNYTYGTNGIAMPSDMPYAVNLIDREKIAIDVQRAKENADFVIVCPHWGTEYTHNENKEQINLAMYLTELGVDLIIGTHPHVIQPVKWLESSNGNRTLVYYSLGNFINATSEYGSTVADRMVGGMANITIEKGADGVTSIKDYSVTPLVTQMLFGRGEITTYKLSDYSPQLAMQSEAVNRDENFSYEFCINLCDEVFAGVKQNR